MGEFYNIIPWNSPYNDNNSVAMGIANGILQGQNNQLNWMNNALSGMLTGSSALSFIGTPGIPMSLNPLDCLNSVNLTNMFTGGGNMFGLPAFGSGMNGFDFSGYWNNVGGVSGGGTSNGGSSTTTVGKQINKLKSLLDKVKDAAKDNDAISIDYTEYNKAKTDEDKLSALKTIYNEINSNEDGRRYLREQIMKQGKIAIMNETGEEKEVSYDEALKAIGYPVDSTCETICSTAKSDIESGNAETMLLQSMKKGNVLKTISAWNSKNTKKEDHLIAYIGTKVNAAKDDESKHKWIEPISTTVHALIDRARVVDNSKVKSQIEILENKLNETIKETSSGKHGNFKLENLKKLSEEFDKLYGLVKLAEANKINAKAKEVYGFVNDFKTDDEDLIKNDFAVDKITEQLKSENIDNVDNLATTINNSTNTNISSVSDLVSNNKLVQVPSITSHNVYTNGTRNLSATKYYVENNGKLYELKGVTGISGDKFKTKTGTADIDSTIESAIQGSALDLNNVSKYSDALKEIVDKGLTEYTKYKGKTIKFNNPVYVKHTPDKGLGGGNYEYWTIKDNELVQINAQYIIADENGNPIVKRPDKDGTVAYSSLGDEDFGVSNTITPDNTGNIITSDTETSIKKHGRSYRKAMYNSKNEKAKEYMNSWLKLDNADEILDFLKGYDDERHWSNSINEKFTAKYVDDICNGGEESAKHVQNVAKQIKKVVDEKGWADELGSDYDALEDLSKGDYERKWYDGLCWGDFLTTYNLGKFLYSPNLAKARKLDNIIDKVIKQYDKANTNES